MKKYRYDYSLIGGDMRQAYLAHKLANSPTIESSVCRYALCIPPEGKNPPDEALPPVASSLAEACNADCIICPIPFSRNGRLNQTALENPLPLPELLSALSSGQSFFAGCIPKDFALAATEKGVKVYDLMDDLSLTYFNTLATAEGAISEAISSSPLNLCHSFCLVLGYGKCGRTLSGYLKGISCYLSVISRKKAERAEACFLADSIGRIEDLPALVREADFIFNTIPSLVLTAPVLAKAKPSVTILDIASAPGGVDFEAARELGLCARLLPGLPGKYSPASSADAIWEAILRRKQRS